MLYYASSLSDYQLKATDGELGKVKELYFDDKQWVLRYFGVDTRKWLPGKKVLLSPRSLQTVDDENRVIELSSDKETVRNSPSLDETSPLTREYEMNLTRYYGWAPYWTGGFLWGREDVPLVGAVTNSEQAIDIQENREETLAEELTHNLREIDELIEKFTVHASDGKIGSINDVLLDGESWKLRYLVVKNSQDFSWKYSLLSPDWTQSVDWVDYNLYLDVTRETVKNGPGIEEKQEISRGTEQDLHTAYGKQTYWNY
ncbi:PRC-barrel domain-containing protein [Virgibacillus senegalensis]|uniref:PRC-barrel domain-containing protein n=1 Tax=Virgibacillus senegalensis TaxID=1499679 RepID=UPI00069EEC4B|nr:PRC-barrel domain-containing protein [Virgibacillus senegalensis]